MTVKELSQLYYLNCDVEMDQVRLDNLDVEIYERRITNDERRSDLSA